MPIHIKYVKKGIGVEFICSGIVTGTDIIMANKEIYSDNTFLDLKYKIVDRTNCEEYRVSSEEIRLVAEQEIAAAKVHRNIVIAIISMTDLQFGISRVYQALVGYDGYKTGVFRDRKSAEEWIEKELDHTDC